MPSARNAISPNSALRNLVYPGSHLPPPLLSFPIRKNFSLCTPLSLLVLCESSHPALNHLFQQLFVVLLHYGFLKDETVSNLSFIMVMVGAWEFL